MIVNLLSDPGFETTHEKREGFLLGHLWHFLHVCTERPNVHHHIMTHFSSINLLLACSTSDKGVESLLHFLAEICPIGLGVVLTQRQILKFLIQPSLGGIRDTSSDHTNLDIGRVFH